MSTELRYDAVVLGGGLLGCFAARHLTSYRLRCALVEAREDVCTGISRSNSAIVYTGCDNKPGTLKARLCVQANRGFEQLCAQLSVPFVRRGSLLVSYGPRGDQVVRRKYGQGQENGVESLTILTGAQAAALEPGLAPGITSALLAPSTGVTDPWALCYAAYENARANGCEIYLNAPATALRREGNDWIITAGAYTIRAGAVLNCCGLEAHRVQELCAPPTVRVIPDRADYLVLEQPAGLYVRHVVFQEPEQKGKGLTLVPTADGKLLLGPSEQPGGEAPHRAVTPEGLAFLRDRAAQVVPGLDLGQVIRAFGAVRPNPFSVRREGEAWVPQDRGIHSFPICNPLPGLWSLIGIKTPGLTCADALGALLAGEAADFLGKTASNPDFDPCRQALPRPRELDSAARRALVQANPAYGRVICRCEDVTEGEILDAIRRGAVTLDGVKRRVGPGLGRCQGSWCTDQVLDLLARTLGVSPGEITQDGPGSPLLGGEGT